MTAGLFRKEQKSIFKEKQTLRRPKEKICGEYHEGSLLLITMRNTHIFILIN